MEVATGDAVVLLDGDLQDPPEVIPALFEKWRQGNDVVYGRRSRREMSVIMSMACKAFYRVFRGLSYVPVPLDAGDFALMDRRVVDELLALPETDQFLRGLRAWVGFKQTGVDYFRPERAFGRSTHSRLKNLWWAKKAIFSFSFVPIELLGYAGAVLTALWFFGGRLRGRGQPAPSRDSARDSDNRRCRSLLRQPQSVAVAWWASTSSGPSKK